MVTGRVVVLGRDASSQRLLEAALATAFEVTDAVDTPTDVVIAPLTGEGIAALERARQLSADATEWVFTYAADESADVARALRDGAFYCLPEPVDLSVLRAVVARCLELRELKRAAGQHASRIEHDLTRAARLQRAMLPAPEARLHGAGVSVAMRCRPCAKVGGDLVDFAEANGRATVLITDVAGHGVSAAMLTTLVKSAFVTSARSGYDPAIVVGGILPSLQPFEAGQFLTLLVVRLDVKRGIIEYVNAGHPPGLLFQKGKVVQQLEAAGPPLMPDASAADYAVQTMKLPAHCGLLLYTDGVTDARGDEGRFGHERMLNVLARCQGGGSTLLERILSSVDAFTSGQPVTDDLTLATVTVGVPGLA